MSPKNKMINVTSTEHKLFTEREAVPKSVNGNRKLYRLHSCVWEITLACCFSCRYCGSRAGAARENELSTDECLDVANQLAELGCKRVSMIGGEVFMRKDWPLIVKKLSDRDVKVSIITNGFLFTEQILSTLKALNVESVAVSLDGTEEIHDAFRQKGSFQRAIAAIGHLTKSGIPTSVITTLHSKNLPYLDDMYDVLKETGIFAWQLQACSPMGNASEASFSTDISFQKVIDFVRAHREKAPFVLGIADNIGYYTEDDGSLRGNPSGKGCFFGCSAGLSSIGIDSVGNVRGCESMYDDAFIEGNLRERTLRDIWYAPNAFSYNRGFRPDMLTGKCRKCEHRLICAGGCRSYNFFTHGKLYESLRCVQ